MADACIGSCAMYLALAIYGSLLRSYAGLQMSMTATENHETETRPPVTMLRMLNASALASLEHQATLDAAVGLSNVSLSDLQKDNGTLQLQQRYRARKKQERLFLIQAEILQRLRVTPWRQSNHSASVLFSQEERERMQQIFERMHQMHQMRQNNGDLQPDQISERTNNVFAERFQSFYPACSKPNHTDRSLWEKPGSFHIFYPISFPTRESNSSTETTILSAKLRLHKHAGTTQLEETNCVDCPSPPASYPSFLLPSASSITVSVYHFVKPLKQHRREKKRLVDSRVVAADHEGWLEFNVAPTLQHWFHNRHRNYGFDIEVDDAAGNKLDPNGFFRNVNCSDPNDMAENESSIFDNETYPTLDLQTAELSRHPLPQHQEQSDEERARGQHLTNGDQQRFFRKRHAGYVYLTHTWNQLCRRETLYVSFQDIGLEGVIVEPGLRVNFCMSVNKRNRENRNDDEDEEDTIHKKEVDCCVPRSYKHLHIHYLAEDGDIHKINLNNLSARHCHCANS